MDSPTFLTSDKCSPNISKTSQRYAFTQAFIRKKLLNCCLAFGLLSAFECKSQALQSPLLPLYPDQEADYWPVVPSIKPSLIGAARPLPLLTNSLFHTGFSPTEFEITCIPLNQKPLLQVSCTAIDFLAPRPPLGIHVVINLQKQRLSVLRYEKVILESPISSGRPGHRTTTGKFEVTQKDLHHFSTLYGYHSGGTYHPAPMRYFVRYNGAEGLHAGDLPGYPASHGCVRLPSGKAAAIFKTVGVGTPVTVITGNSRPPQQAQNTRTQNTDVSAVKKEQTKASNGNMPALKRDQTASF